MARDSAMARRTGARSWATVDVLDCGCASIALSSDTPTHCNGNYCQPMGLLNYDSGSLAAVPWDPPGHIHAHGNAVTMLLACYGSQCNETPGKCRE